MTLRDLLRRERKADRLADVSRPTAQEIVRDLSGGTETAAELTGLAQWLEAELAAGTSPKYLVQVAANAAIVLAARIQDREDCWLERRAPGL